MFMHRRVGGAACAELLLVMITGALWPKDNDFDAGGCHNRNEQRYLVERWFEKLQNNLSQF